MPILLQIVLVTATVGLIGLIAAVMLVVGRLWPREALRHFFAFATGTLLGASLLVLLPEALHEIGRPRTGLVMVTAGILLFLLLERFVHPREPVDGQSPLAGATSLVVRGDTVHNFLDGAVIGIALLADWRIAVTTSIAVVLHEIPQEIADFSVLLYAGWQRRWVLVVNVVSAMAGVLGGLFAYTLGEIGEAFIPGAVAVVAGGFLYIALSHLLPEIRRDLSLRALAHLGFLLAGIALIWSVETLVPHGTAQSGPH